MNNIFVGTTSETKIKIIKKCLSSDFNIIPKEVDSGIADQPLDEKTTIMGAINRAKNAIDNNSDYLFSVGMEGGLVMINNLYYLVCVVVIIDSDGNKYLGVSNKLPLPTEVSKKVLASEQFGEVIRDFKKNIQKGSSKLIAHIDELITRKESFITAFKTAFFAYSFKNRFI